MLFFLLSFFSSMVPDACATAANGAEPASRQTKSVTHKRTILVIYSQTVKYPWSRMVRDAFAKGVENLPAAERPEVYEEYLDESRLGTTATGAFVAGYFSRKYRSVTFSAVLAETRDACDFLMRHPGLFPGVPRYLFDFNSGPLPSAPGTIAYYSTLDCAKSIRTIMSLLPDLRRIIVVGDQSPNHQLFLANLRKKSVEFSGNVILEFWENLSVAELYDKSGKLPRDSAICYLGIFRDRLGEAHVPAQVARQLSTVASAPVFGIVDSFMGAAVVGGYMDSAEREGELMVRAAMAEKGKPLHLNQADIQAALSGYKFDDRQLKRWRIPDSRLPKGSVILNREPSLWESHRGWIVSAVSAFGVETLLILTLIRINRKRHQGLELLEEARLTLEQKVAERTAELADATQEAHRANRAKSDFLARMSHDIRTPLNAILGLSHLELVTPSATPHDSLQKIQISAQTLLALINDILDFSKIAAGKLELEQKPFSLFRLLGELESMALYTAEQKGVLLRFRTSPESPDFLVGDELRLRQVLINLISNGVKFTESGEVVVSAEPVQMDEICAFIRFTVADTGIGIPLEQQPRLFQAFTQGDNSITRRYGGTGLGLAICRQLVELMGGEISLESSPGEGSRFTFTLQFQRVSVESTVEFQPVNQDDVTPHELAGARVLLVEDNELNRQVTRRYLEELGLVVSIACDGLEAVKLLVAGGQFDVALMDQRMPGMDGCEATRVIREELKQKSLPIIAVTANASEHDRHNCLAAGMNDFLAKPISPRQLLATLQRWIDVVPTEASTRVYDSLPGLLEVLARLEAYVNELTSGESMDFVEIGLVGHNIKGLGLTFALPEVARLGEVIQTAADTGTTERVVAAVSKLNELLTILRHSPALASSAGSRFPPTPP